MQSAANSDYVESPESWWNIDKDSNLLRVFASEEKGLLLRSQEPERLSVWVS